MPTETMYRSCPTCEASCGLVMEVDRDAKEVISIKGDDNDHRSKGYVCAKSQAFHHIYQDPERLRHPVKKVDGQWQQISWEQAYNEVGEKLKAIRDESGKDSIALYYGNPNGHNFNTMVYTQLFTTMLNTERFFSAGSVDQQPKNLSCELLFGDGWVFPIPDIQRSDFFVCMGGNPLVSQGSLMSAPNAGEQIGAIAKRGKVVVIDPRRTETADIASQHIFIKPGSDALFLLAWVNVLFEEDRVALGRLAEFTDGVEQVREAAKAFTPENTEAHTGVPAQTLRTLIKEFSEADAPVLYGRIGLCTQQFGTLASWLVDVVNTLTGRLDAPGGAMFPQAATELPPPAVPEVPELGLDRFRTRVRDFPEYMGMMPASLMGEELEYEGEDRARAMITVAGNPVLTVPNGKRVREAMDKLDLIVCLDFYINETTSLADYILPSTSQLEHSNYDFLFQTTSVRNFARYSPEVFEPEAGAQQQHDIMTEIVARINGMQANDLHAMMADGLAGQIQAAPRFEALDTQTIKHSEFDGTEQLLDMMLRAGPYGDGFDEDSEGLNLKKVKAAQHGVDLGALKPRLPELLKTKDKRLNIAPDIILNDIPRLKQWFAEDRSDKVQLIGRRHIRDMNSWLHNLPNYVRGKNRCTLLVNPVDATRLNLSDGGKARIKARIGEEVVDVAISDEVMPGVVSLPHGFGHRYKDTGQTTAKEKHPGVSANDLVEDEVMDMPSGTSVVNGTWVIVEAA